MGYDLPKHDTVLLTGATGMVGSLVLADLLRSGLNVAVIARPDTQQSAVARIESVMRRLERRYERRFIRPFVLVGDLSLPDVGLSDHDQRWISDNCSTVIHAAANLVFRPASENPDNEPYRTNLDGTGWLLKICSQAGIREWHYVSTAYVAGLRSGTVLETEGDTGHAFANDYERSKILSEQLLNRAAAAGNLTVYRPSIVIDPHPESVMPAVLTINGGFSAYEMQSRKFGVPEYRDGFQNLGFRTGDRKNLVMAEWVARMIVQIFRRPQLHGHTYHLTSPQGTLLAEIEAAFHSVMSSTAGVAKRADPATAKKAEELTAPFVSAFRPYFRDDPVFDRTNTCAAMQLANQSDCPGIGQAEITSLCQRRTNPVRRSVSSVTGAQSRLAATPKAEATASTGPISTGKSVTGCAQGAGRAQSWDRADGGRHGSAGRNGASLASTKTVGLILTGPDGGEFLLQHGSSGVVVVHGRASSECWRVYTSTATWNHLRNQEALAFAVASGEILFESDDEPVSVDAVANRLEPFLGLSIRSESSDSNANDVSSGNSANGRH